MSAMPRQAGEDERIAFEAAGAIPEDAAAEPAVPVREENPAPAAPPRLKPQKAALYIFTSILAALTQGLGMNLMAANIYQLQGSLSATVNELAWLSAVYLAPYASMSLALFNIRTQNGLRPFAELGIVWFVLT